MGENGVNNSDNIPVVTNTAIKPATIKYNVKRCFMSNMVLNNCFADMILFFNMKRIGTVTGAIAPMINKIILAGVPY